MMKYFYAVMYTVNSEFLVSGAKYVEGKVTLKGLTEAEIVEYKGDVNRIDHKGFNPDNDPEQEGLSTEQLSTMMTGLANQEPNTVLGVLSIPQGKWLYANHEAFKPKQEQSI